MSITDISVRRPAAIIMVIIFTIGIGIWGYLKLGADLFPSVDLPVITITASYPGAGVNEIQNDILKPIEDELSGLRGIDSINSTATIGLGVTIVQFTMETNVQTAFIDVQQAISNAQAKLPKDASKPAIQKVDLNAIPVLILAITGKVDYESIYKKTDEIKQALEKVNGVGNIVLSGGVDKQVAIKINKTALDYYNVSINSIVSKLMAENINFPAGELDQGVKTQTLRVLGQYKSLEEIKNLRIPGLGGDVPLSELAQVSIEYPEAKNITRFKGESSLALIVQKQSDANVVEVTTSIKDKLNELKKEMPKNINLEIAIDTSVFISSTLNDVKTNLFEGIIITSIVMFLFMRRIKSALIVLVAIPTSLIATFFMMYAFGFNLNILTLIALSLCIGILVDDSIVVIENIQRHLKMGKTPMQAAIEGRKEIAMAAIAITLCDIVVFGPIAFTSGIIGKYFREFGLTVVFATAFSLFVSFTVTPMLASKLLKKHSVNDEDDDNIHEYKGKFGKLYNIMLRKYSELLNWSLENRWKVIGVVACGIVISILLIPLNVISAEFTPASDQGRFNIEIELNPGSTINQTNEKVKVVEKYLKEIKEVKDFFTNVNAGKASIMVNMVDKNLRKLSQKEVAAQVRSWAKKLTGTRVFIVESAYGNGGNNTKPIVFNILGNDIGQLRLIAKTVEEKMKKIPGVVDVESSVQSLKSELNLKIDHIAAEDYGLTTFDIGNTLRTAINGANAGVLRKNDKEDYDIVVKFEKGQIKTLEDVESIKILTQAGKQIYIGDVAKVEVEDSPVELRRMDRQTTVQMSASLQNRSLGDINKDIEKEIYSIKLPKEYSFKTGGESKSMNDAFFSLLMALVASIVLIYMVLVVLYESYLTPFVRLLALPCGIIGALIALAVTRTSLNMMTLIGLIMLDGLASKNGTLLIDYTNTLMRTRGMKLRDALVMAGTRRLRPIIMTSVTMIAGMIPVAISRNAGSELKSGMAIVLIGGVFTSTLIAPILLPVVYTLIDDSKAKFLLKRANRSKEEAKA